MNDDHDHFGPDCPQCHGMSEATKVLGGLSEAMEKMIENGTFARLGREMAMRREEAALRVILGPKHFPKGVTP